MGYHMAGFDVVGVDTEPQPNYPFKFIQADALTVDLDGYDAYSASPPCQGYSITRFTSGRTDPHLIAPTRERLEATGKPYTIENVEQAKWDMRDPITLCGSSFGLRVRRHRLFECNFAATSPACEHEWQDAHKPYMKHLTAARGGYHPTGVVPVYGANQLRGGRELHFKAIAMGIDWMTTHELNNAIPPVMTRHLGKELRKALSI